MGVIKTCEGTMLDLLYTAPSGCPGDRVSIVDFRSAGVLFKHWRAALTRSGHALQDVKEHCIYIQQIVMLLHACGSLE